MEFKGATQAEDTSTTGQHSNFDSRIAKFHIPRIPNHAVKATWQRNMLSTASSLWPRNLISLQCPARHVSSLESKG
eukprot:4481329-Amphidinium_carterae.1